MKNLIHSLCSCSGISGNESKINKIVFERLKDFSEVFIDENFNNVFARIGKKNAKRKILLDAHIDQVGMMVTHIENGFLKVSPCGSLDPRILPGNKVLIFAEEPIIGIVCSTPPHLSKTKREVISIEDIIIDTCFGKDAEKLIEIGTYVGFYPEVSNLIENKISAPALDNRAGVASLIKCAEILNESNINWNKLDCEVNLLFSSREEVSGHAGAVIGAYEIKPDEALIVDVSFGLHPGVSITEAKPLSKGPLIGISPVLSEQISNKLKKLAKENNIPCQFEVMGGKTSTNADAIGVIECGIKSGLLSIPLRYMHSSLEVINLNDLENTAKLLASYILN